MIILLVLMGFYSDSIMIQYSVITMLLNLYQDFDMRLLIIDYGLNLSYCDYGYHLIQS